MKKINGKRMKELMDVKSVNIIDVDIEAEFKTSHIMGALNIPHNKKDFVEKVQKKYTKKTEDIVLCANGKYETELGKLSKQLESAGYESVYQYKAGPMEWKSANLSVQRSA